MRNLLARLWIDDGAALIVTEWVFVAMILVLGTVTGLVAVRQAVLTELTEAADAVLSFPRSCFSSGRGEDRPSATSPRKPRQAFRPQPGPSELRACD